MSERPPAAVLVLPTRNFFSSVFVSPLRESEPTIKKFRALDSFTARVFSPPKTSLWDIEPTTLFKPTQESSEVKTIPKDMAVAIFTNLGLDTDGL